MSSLPGLYVTASLLRSLTHRSTQSHQEKSRPRYDGHGTLVLLLGKVHSFAYICAALKQYCLFHFQ